MPDFQEQLDDLQDRLLDLNDAVEDYFTGLGTYGVAGWSCISLGLILAVAGLVLL